MNYISIRKYLKKRDIMGKDIFLGRTSNSYIIGPKIDSKFDEKSFYKRITSSSLYFSNTYKTILKQTAYKFLSRYYEELKTSNEMLEIFTNGEIIIHKIIPLSGDMYEKK